MALAPHSYLFQIYIWSKYLFVLMCACNLAGMAHTNVLLSNGGISKSGHNLIGVRKNFYFRHSLVEQVFIRACATHIGNSVAGRGSEGFTARELKSG